MMLARPLLFSVLVVSLAACAGTPDPKAAAAPKDQLYVTGSRIAQERAKGDSAVSATNPGDANQLYQRYTPATSLGK